MTRTALALMALSWICAPAVGSAQDRSASARDRLELSFDHGYGWSSEDGYAELGADLRLHAPNGLGGALRVGAAVQGFSNAVALDLGFSARLDLVAAPRAGLQAGFAIGPSVAYGPFDGGDVWALGGWAMLHLDFWFRNFFVGIAASGHLLAVERFGQPVGDAGRPDPIVTLTPLIRIGGEWWL